MIDSKEQAEEICKKLENHPVWQDPSVQRKVEGEGGSRVHTLLKVLECCGLCGYPSCTALTLAALEVDPNIVSYESRMGLLYPGYGCDHDIHTTTCFR